MSSMQLKFNPPSCLVALLLLAHLLLVTAGAADPKLQPRDLALIEEAYHLWTTQADKIWPGASKLRTPMIYIGETEEYAIGFDHPLKGFAQAGFAQAGIAQASIANNKLGPVQIRTRSFPRNLSASFPVEGTATVVIGRPEALQMSPEAWAITACHEMFHVYQSSRGSTDKINSLKIGPPEESGWQLSFPFPYRDPDVMRLIHLQGYLLWLTANESGGEDAMYNAGTALEANRVYRSRLDNLMPDGKAKNYSLFQEWSEGVAAYTEFKIAEAAATSNHQPTAAFSKLPDFQGYASVWKAAYQHRPYLVKHAGRAAKDRTAFYHLGMGKALALDVVLPAWKTKYFLPGLWLDDLLKEASESQ